MKAEAQVQWENTQEDRQPVATKLSETWAVLLGFLLSAKIHLLLFPEGFNL